MFSNGPHRHMTKLSPLLKYSVIMSDRAEPLTSSLFSGVLKYVPINYETGLCEKCCMVQEARALPIPFPPSSSLSC